MSLPFNVPSFPDVPIAAGVPSVLRQKLASVGSIANSLPNIAIGAAQQAVSGIISNAQQIGSNLVNGAFGELPTALTGDSSGVQNAAVQPGQWGIFQQDFNKAISPDSIKSLEYQQSWRLPNYPMEQGAFQSYNKVQTPFNIRISMTKGGTTEDRQNFLADIEIAANSTNLYIVVTPDITYRDMSIEHYDYKRTSTNGVTLLTVEMSLLEIREAPASTMTNTATTAAAAQVNGGTVQAVPVTDTPNTTGGQPTSSAQFESGAAAPQASVAPPDQVTPTQAAAVTATETPAVKSTSPQFDNTPRDADGNPVEIEGTQGNGNPIPTKGPVYVKNADGTLNKYSRQGDLIEVVPSNYFQ